MPSGPGKWVIGLLLTILGAQVLVWNQQAQLTGRVEEMARQMNDMNRTFTAQLANLSAAMTARDEVPAWMTRPLATAIADPNCAEHTARVAWGLKEWTPGTKARLQFRRGAGEEWQEARVRDLGQQSYEAEFPLPGGPGLLWKVTVATEESARTGLSPQTVYWPPEAFQHRTGQPAMPAFQYRIVLDVPGGSRASAPFELPLGRQLTAAAGFNVTTGPQGSYSVAAWVDSNPPNVCVRVGTVVARTFAGGAQVGEQVLTQSGDGLKTTWKSEKRLTRIDLVVRFGNQESVIPVDLPL